MINSPYFTLAVFLLLILSVSVFISTSFFPLRIFNLNLLTRWTILFGLSFITIASFSLIGLFFVEKLAHKYLHVSMGVTTVVVVSMSVLVFDLFKKAISNFVDQMIFKSPDYQLLLNKIKTTIDKSKTIDDATTALLKEFKEIWQVEHAGFLIWNTHKSKYDIYPQQAFSEQIIAKSHEDILPTDFLVKTLTTERRLFKYGVVLEKELTDLGNRSTPGARTTYWKIRRTMRWLGAAVCAPMMTGPQLMGAIVLGPKKDASPFKDEDKKLLSHIGQLVTVKLSEHILV